MQNAAAKLIKRARKFDHVTPLLKQLHWLPIKDRIAFKIMCLTFKALHNRTPSYLVDIHHLYHPTRSLRSSHHQLLTVPRMNRKNAGERSFAYAAPSLWNKLPLELRMIDNYSCFKSKLKTFCSSNRISIVSLQGALSNCLDKAPYKNNIIIIIIHMMIY